MTKQYFRVIKSEHPNVDTAVREHQERLENYLKYKYPETNANMSRLGKPKEPLSYEIEVESQSTAMTIVNHNVVIVTTLCCEDESADEY